MTGQAEGLHHAGRDVQVVLVHVDLAHRDEGPVQRNANGVLARPRCPSRVCPQKIVVAVVDGGQQSALPHPLRLRRLSKDAALQTTLAPAQWRALRDLRRQHGGDELSPPVA